MLSVLLTQTPIALASLGEQFVPIKVPQTNQPFDRLEPDDRYLAFALGEEPIWVGYYQVDIKSFELESLEQNFMLFMLLFNYRPNIVVISGCALCATLLKRCDPCRILQ